MNKSDVNTSRSRILILGASLWALLAIGIYIYSSHLAELRLEQQSRSRLIDLSSKLEIELDKYRTLPKALTLHPLMGQALSRENGSDYFQEASRLLARFNQDLLTDSIYLISTEGITLASSNWQSEDSFVGVDYRFRPYFQEAIKGFPSSYFALGTVSGTRGYYFSQPVISDGQVAGVLVLKVALTAFENDWLDDGLEFLLTDIHGVVFLSSYQPWNFRPLSSLPADIELQILEQRQYGASLRAPLTESYSIEDVLLEPRLQLSKDGYIAHYYQTYTDMVGVGWRLFAMAPVSIVSYSAVRSLMFFTLIYILLFLIALSWRRTVDARRELAIINEKLEHIVDDRTIELSQANTQLIEIIEKYKETEITLKQTQGELIQSAKLAMLGEMAASINHELNQPLAAMRIYAENLQAFVKRGDPEAIKRNSKHILDLNQMMAKIVGQYKIFARKSTGRVMAVSLKETISESLAILESNISKSGAKISLKNLEQDLFVLADKVPLEQVVINLVNNALQAVEDCDQGKIWISATKEEEKIILVVSDNGPGFTEEQLDKLFTPFFTTKDQGLGMGLTISQRIIESFNGSISAINRIGGGAEFSLSLPRAQMGAER